MEQDIKPSHATVPLSEYLTTENPFNQRYSLKSISRENVLRLQDVPGHVLQSCAVAELAVTASPPADMYRHDVNLPEK